MSRKAVAVAKVPDIGDAAIESRHHLASARPTSRGVS
jgi:hypothetical protein